MDHVRLGGLGDDVSVMSLGSWNTFSSVGFEDGVDIVRAALGAGINLFDIAYYWDKPYTEVIFGHYMRTLGVPRSDYLIAQKVWLWDYPGDSLATQVKKSLVRLGLSYIDIAMVSRPTPDLDQVGFIEECAALVEAGLARSWGITSWEPELAQRAFDVTAATGSAAPVQLQLQYSIVRRAFVETAAYDALFAATGLRLQPADTLEGGILAGKLDRDRFDPDDLRAGKTILHRNIARDAGNIRPAIRAYYPQLETVAAKFGATPAQFALAYVLRHPHCGSALVGVSSVQQLSEDLGALSLARSDGQSIADEVDKIDVGRGAHPLLFTPRA